MPTAETKSGRYTASVACFASRVTYSDLNYREHEGLLKRLSGPRRPHKRKTYSLDDIIVLAIMQLLVNLGVGQRDALQWALLTRDEAQRCGGWGKTGSLEIRLYDESQDVRFTNLPTGAPAPAPGENIKVVINVDHISEKVRGLVEAAVAEWGPKRSGRRSSEKA
jgi:hypothetical protein